MLHTPFSMKDSYKPKFTQTNTNLGELRIPPQNLEAEQSVLGSIMLDKDAIIKIADILKVGDFYKDDHNDIYEVILELYEQREPIDVLSLSNKLDERKQLEELRELTWDAITVDDFDHSELIAASALKGKAFDQAA